MMLRSLFTILLALALLIPATRSMAAQYQIAFQVATGPVPPMSYDPASSIGKANSAFMAKYGMEQGLVGTTIGNNNELIIVVTNAAVSRQIWSKMLNAHDAYSAPNGVGYIQFNDSPTPQPMPPQPVPQPQPPMPQPMPQPQPPQPNSYQYVGHINIEETETGRFLFGNGAPAIKSFILTLDQYCPLTRAGVEVVGSKPVQPTRLVRTFRTGARSVAFEHTVNGGQGALLTAIDITVGVIGGPGIIESCDVEVYARF